MATNTHQIPELDAKGLREFGVVTGAIVAGLFGLFFPWVFDRQFPGEFPWWPWMFCAVLGGWGLIAPNSLRPVYRGWMRFGLFFPWVLELSWPRWPWIFAGVLTAVGLVAPMTLRPVYKTWMRFGLLLSKITTPIIMGLVFFLVITPIGLIRRLSSADAMKQKFDSQESYRITSKKPQPNKMERPF